MGGGQDEKSQVANRNILGLLSTNNLPIIRTLHLVQFSLIIRQGGAGGKDSCQGDSGGPLVVKVMSSFFPPFFPIVMVIFSFFLVVKVISSNFSCCHFWPFVVNTVIYSLFLANFPLSPPPSILFYRHLLRLRRCRYEFNRKSTSM